MKKERSMLSGRIASVLLIGITISCSDPSSGSDIRRTELQRHDIEASGREVIQSRIDFDEGTRFGKHTHPGEEIIYVIGGLLEYQVEGKTPVTLSAGEVLFVPAGTIHAAKNVGKGKATELATYIVEKGKPLLVLTE
jgi:quercetin dioxygenase-like cupin family protein